jgi:hypothetical protein
MKYLNAILLIIVVGATIGLFYLLGNPDSSLFYFNLIFAAVLEVIFFGSVIKVSSERLFNVPNLAVVVQLNRYVIFAAIIMIAYNLALRFVGEDFLDKKWYFALLILLTIIYVIIVIFTLQGGSYQQQQSEEVKVKMMSRTDLSDKQKLLISNYKRTIAENKELDYPTTEDCKKAISQINDRLSTIPIAKFEQNPDKANELGNQIQQLNEQINQIDISNKEEAEKQIKVIAKSAYGLADQINLLK